MAAEVNALLADDRSLTAIDAMQRELESLKIRFAAAEAIAAHVETMLVARTRSLWDFQGELAELKTLAWRWRKTKGVGGANPTGAAV